MFHVFCPASYIMSAIQKYNFTSLLNLSHDSFPKIPDNFRLHIRVTAILKVHWVRRNRQGSPENIEADIIILFIRH